MARNTPAAAYRRYVDVLQTAMSCIAHGRFIGRFPHNLHIDRPYSLILGDGDPVPLGGKVPLAFSAGHRCRIVLDPSADEGPYRATTIQYWYQFATAAGVRLLTLHWTPETTDPGQRTHPHLHVESGIVNPHGPFAPDRFNKLHIPTERLPIEAIVRFAIEELGVTPIRMDWNELLTSGYASFLRLRRRSPGPRDDVNRV